jgi:hypothetical protein
MSNFSIVESPFFAVSPVSVLARFFGSSISLASSSNRSGDDWRVVARDDDTEAAGLIGFVYTFFLGIPRGIERDSGKLVKGANVH